MRLITIIMLAACMQASAGAWAQRVTLKMKNAPLEKIFSEIRKQTGYEFLGSAELIRSAPKLTVNVENVTLHEALDICFNGLQLTYELEDKTIIIKQRTTVDIVIAHSLLADVSGRITDENGEPVGGATVKVKGTDIGTATNSNGYYQLKNVDENATLIITGVNIESIEVSVGNRTSINISAKIKVRELDAPVVVAYNTTTQRANTGSVSVIKGEQIQTLPNRSFDRSLQGLVPGLLVTGGTGQPGGGVSNFVLRGIATATPADFGSTVRYPLVVIDGVPVTQDNFQMYIENTAIPITNPLAQLNPSDIETVSVLKDAAAIALYGAKASNGVILVTTKKGRSGKTVFNFRHQTDVASRLTGNVELLNPQEYMELLYETYKNTPRNPSPWTDALIKTDLIGKFPYIVKAPGDTVFYSPTDWPAQTFNDHAVTMSNEFSMSGGNDKSNFYLNLEYTKQNGVLKNTSYDRKSIRFNFENRPANWIKIGINTALSYNEQEYGNTLRGFDGYSNSLFSPLNTVKLIDGSYAFNYASGTPGNAPLSNPVAAAEYNINYNNSFRGLGKIYAEIDFMKYFKLITNVGFDFMFAESKEKVDPRLRDRGNNVNPNTATAGRIEEQDTRRANVITTNMLRFDKIIHNEHAINVILGQEAQILNQRNMLLAVRGLASPIYDQINSPGVTVFRQGGAKTKETLLSLFGQANYGFRNKYFLTASIRRDGSSRFGDDKRYGTYWSTGLGWIISAEKFMNGTSSWLSYLKLRGSIGAAGNAGAINARTRYDQLTNTTFLGSVALYPTGTPGNPDVQWERTFTQDAGIEVRFMKDRISITADIYKRLTSDLLYSINLAQNSGYNSVLANIGKMENKGVELSLSADIIRNKNFRWNLNANWSTNENVLVKADVPTATLATPLTSNMEGQNFNSFYLIRWYGVDPADGAPQWYDSSGKATKIPAQAKKEFVGKPQPDGFGSITNTIVYKDFDFSFRLYYQYGYQVYISDQSLNDGYYPYVNQDRRALDRWQKPGDVAANPKRVLNNTLFTYSSTRFLYDGDHIRLQNVSIGYNLPKRITDRLHLSMFRIYVQGNNLYTWTKYPGQDPDNVNSTGSSQWPYPNQRSFSFGLNVKF